MAKKFFYVCAGLLLLMGAYAFGARKAGAQLGIQDVAFLSGQVPDGGTIPLPHYADGTEALESDCQWIVSPATFGPSYPNPSPMFTRCTTQGRNVSVYWCPESSCGPVGDCGVLNPGCARRGTANYLIIAVRNTGPTPVQAETWGKIKSRYR